MKTPDAQIRLDLASAVPAYRQIADQLRAFVVEGVLQSGDILLPVRRLALELGVHFNTVAEAYRLLEQENLLEITRGHGASVIERPYPPVDPDTNDNFRQRLRELVAEARARGVNNRKIVRELEAMAATLEDL